MNVKNFAAILVLVVALSLSTNVLGHRGRGGRFRYRPVCCDECKVNITAPLYVNDPAQPDAVLVQVPSCSRSFSSRVVEAFPQIEDGERVIGTYCNRTCRVATCP